MYNGSNCYMLGRAQAPGAWGNQYGFIMYRAQSLVLL